MARVRFVRQPTLISCGPTAIINAAKWAGLSCTLKNDFGSISLMCDTKADNGTHCDNFDKVLRLKLRTAAKIRKRLRPSFASIVSYVRRHDRAVVLLYWRRANESVRKYDDYTVEGHYILVIPSGSNDSVICVNDYTEETLTTTSMRDFRKKVSFLRRWKGENIPIAWFLRTK